MGCGAESGRGEGGGDKGAATREQTSDATVTRVAETVTKGYRHDIGVWSNSRGELLVFPHAHATTPETGAPSHHGPPFPPDPATGQALSRTAGSPRTQPPRDPARALPQCPLALPLQPAVRPAPPSPRLAGLPNAPSPSYSASLASVSSETLPGHYLLYLRFFLWSPSTFSNMHESSGMSPTSPAIM